MVKKYPILSLVLLLAMMAMACNLPSRGEITPTPNALTEVAQTVEANLTQAIQTEQATDTPQVVTVPPTVTLEAPTKTPVPPTATNISVPCDRAQFVADVTVPDGTEFVPGKEFVKTWRLKNTGSCTWTTSYALVFDSGDAMNGPASANLTGSVAPGQTIDISADMKAPDSVGTYRGNWKLRNASNAKFGLGGDASQPFYVIIKVVGTPTPTSTSGPALKYDFIANYCSAEWVSGAGTLSCPGGTGDAEGFVVKLDNPKLENGVFAGVPGLETHPEWVNNGVITGKFPAINVKNGFRFKSEIGCLNGGASCDVKFQFNYRADGGPLQSLGTWSESYDGAIQSLNIDLSSLAGSSVEFVLAVQANGASDQDWAVWINPRIEK